MMPLQTTVGSLEAQTQAQPVVEEDSRVLALSLSQQRFFRAKFLGYFAVHTLITGCSAALMELEPTVTKCLEKSVLANRNGWIIASFFVAFLLLVATALDTVFPTVVRVAVLALGCMALGTAYA